MKKILFLIIILILGCKSERAPLRILDKLGENNSNVKIKKRHDLVSDTFDNLDYDFYINSNAIYSITFDRKNRPFSAFSYLFPDKRNVGPQYYFYEHSTKLNMMYFLDSSYFPQGPWFIYKKNGKIKHLLLMKNGFCNKVIYTCSSKKLHRDTIFMIKLIRMH